MQAIEYKAHIEPYPRLKFLRVTVRVSMAVQAECHTIIQVESCRHIGAPKDVMCQNRNVLPWALPATTAMVFIPLPYRTTPKSVTLLNQLLPVGSWLTHFGILPCAEIPALKPRIPGRIDTPAVLCTSGKYGHSYPLIHATHHRAPNMGAR